MDGHARWLPAGALNEVFGIRRPTPARQPELASTRPEVAIQLAAGASALEKLDGAPAVIRNQYGKGAALYLNFFLDG